jgi:hypothetical protein
MEGCRSLSAALVHVSAHDGATLLDALLLSQERDGGLQDRMRGQPSLQPSVFAVTNALLDQEGAGQLMRTALRCRDDNNSPWQRRRPPGRGFQADSGPSPSRSHELTPDSIRGSEEDPKAVGSE